MEGVEAALRQTIHWK